MKRRKTIPFWLLLILTIAAGVGIWYMAFYKPYGEIEALIPLEDGTVLMVRKGTSEDKPDWLVRENPAEGKLLWKTELEGNVTWIRPEEGFQIGKGAIALHIHKNNAGKYSYFSVHDLESGEKRWETEEWTTLMPTGTTSNPFGHLLFGNTRKKSPEGGSGMVELRDFRTGNILNEWEMGIWEEGECFFWKDFWVCVSPVGREMGLINMQTGESRSGPRSFMAYPLPERILLHRKPEKATESDSLYTVELFDPISGKSDTLQYYESIDTRLQGGGWYQGQISWLLMESNYQLGQLDTVYIESAMPSLSSQTVFFSLASGDLQNGPYMEDLYHIRPEFNPLIGAQTRFAPLIFPLQEPRKDTNIYRNRSAMAELIMLDVQELEVAWNSLPQEDLYDWEIIRNGDLYYLNGRGGYIALFDGNSSELQTAVFIPGAPNLRSYMFSKDKIWVTYDHGWCVLDAKNLRVVMKSDKDFEPADVADEIRLKFGIR